jgi:copper(I)-binding protein
VAAKAFKASVIGLAACAAVASVALTGCGAGQVSQTANQEPAVNGAAATAGNIALRNVHLRAPQVTDYVQPGADAELLLVAANNSADVNDKLVSITSDIGNVTLTGDGTVPAGGVLVVGEPDGQLKALDAAEHADAVKAEVALTKPITNGLTYPFTFNFEKSGQTTVNVPISAGETPRRDGEPNAGVEKAESDTDGAH